MAPSDVESELSEAPTTLTTPFTIAAKSTDSSKPPAKATRNLLTRRPVVPPNQPKQTKKRPKPPTPRPSDNHASLADIPIDVPERSDEEEETSEDSNNNSDLDISHTPGPGSSVSQTSHSSVKRPRAKTSTIHTHIITRGDQFVCRTCSKAYHSSGGSGAIARHLKKEHGIDPTVSAFAEKRVKDRTSIDAAILRGVEINIQATEKRKADLLEISLDKTTLEYLYLQWIITQDIPFKQVRNKEFRAFLDYINPVANQVLPKSDSTIKSHSEDLFAEGKQRLRHMLATALSDIHITCDMWTSSNHLGLLAVVAHFTSEKLELCTVTLGLVELQGEHSGLNQAAIVLEILNDFGIRNKLGYMVMDNVGSNDSLIKAIATSLNEEGVPYDAT